MARAYNPFPYPGEDEPKGLALPALCASVWSVWYRCQDGVSLFTGEALPFWPETDDEYRYGWQRGVTSIIPSVERADATPVAALARELYLSVQSNILDAHPGRQWDDLPGLEKLIWKVLVLHLVKMLLWDDEDGSVEDWEEQSKMQFLEARERLEQTQKPLEQSQRLAA